MTLNAIFDNVKIFDVQQKLEVVMGQSFVLEVIDPPAELKVFTDNDPVLEVNTGHIIEAVSLGESKIRFMTDTSVVKDLDIFVVEGVQPNAKTLGGKLHAPVKK